MRYQSPEAMAAEQAVRDRVAELDAADAGWRDQKHSNGLPKFRTDGTPLDFVGTPYGKVTGTDDASGQDQVTDGEGVGGHTDSAPIMVEGKPVESPQGGVTASMLANPETDLPTLPKDEQAKALEDAPVMPPDRLKAIEHPSPTEPARAATTTTKADKSKAK